MKRHSERDTRGVRSGTAGVGTRAFCRLTAGQNGAVWQCPECKRYNVTAIDMAALQPVGEGRCYGCGAEHHVAYVAGLSENTVVARDAIIAPASCWSWRCTCGHENMTVLQDVDAGAEQVVRCPGCQKTTALKLTLPHTAKP